MGKKRAERESIRAIEKEYREFKRLVLQKGKENIWRYSAKIHFYCMAREYFRYCQERARWEILEGLTLPIRAMWNCYLKYEYLEYTTWQGIEGILEQMEEDCRKIGIEPTGKCG